MKGDIRTYLREIGSKGGKKRAKKGKIALSLIAQKGWNTRRERLADLTRRS